MSITASSTSRAERTLRTRESIVEAARALFVEQGYRATSLRDVAAAAELSHPALLRHFSSKGALLGAVVTGFGDALMQAVVEPDSGEPPDAVDFVAIAAHNATIPGYLPLFASLVGEASAASHPAHELMKARTAWVNEVATATLDEGIDDGTVAADRDARREALRSIAAWDGLQLLELYLPERVSVVDALKRHESLIAHPFGWRSPDDGRAVGTPASPLPGMPPLDALAGTEPAEGYRAGRERRAEILERAMALFAETGYGDTSLREIAEQVGVTKSALFHHFPSKEALLLAVLRERDRAISTGAERRHGSSAAEILRSLPDGARENARRAPGLIELYAVISCEAVPADHPAHRYFADRLALVLEDFTELFTAAAVDGELPAHRDPAHEAAWLVALWDGLQYQWLYDREHVDVAEELRRHLEDVLPR